MPGRTFFEFVVANMALKPSVRMRPQGAPASSPLKSISEMPGRTFFEFAVANQRLKPK
jgi:hypothetical protein